jgi:Hypoxia induced protein conserved region
LVPIGCLCTVYALTRGIRAFQQKDVVKSQQMMKYRVGFQFLTLAAFVGYVGIDQFNLTLAPMYQDAMKTKEHDESEDKGLQQRTDQQ